MESPFAGRWVANLERSKRHPSNLFRRAYIDISVERDVLTLTHAYIDESGRAEHGENELQVDGEVHDRANGYAVRAAWNGTHAFETTATKDGVVVGEGRYEVSEDESTLTITGPDQLLGLQRRIA